jgi:hypothetical protein
MSSRTLRMGGWLLVIAAVLSLVTTVLGIVIPGPAGPNGPPPNIVSIINIISGILFLVGLPAAYLVQRRQVGILGLIGIIALWLTALLFDIVLSIISMTFVPSSQAAAGSPPAFLFALFITGSVLELIGGILFGLKTIQARVFPAAIGWLLISWIDMQLSYYAQLLPTVNVPAVPLSICLFLAPQAHLVKVSSSGL